MKRSDEPSVSAVSDGMAGRSVDVEDVRRTDYGAFTWRYTERDVALYNLSLGCRWDEGRYVYEGADGFGPLPTFGVIPPYHELLPSLPLHRIIPNFNPVRLTADLHCCGAVMQRSPFSCGSCFLA